MAVIQQKRPVATQQKRPVAVQQNAGLGLKKLRARTRARSVGPPPSSTTASPSTSTIPSLRQRSVRSIVRSIALAKNEKKAPLEAKMTFADFDHVNARLRNMTVLSEDTPTKKAVLKLLNTSLPLQAMMSDSGVYLLYTAATATNQHVYFYSSRILTQIRSFLRSSGADMEEVARALDGIALHSFARMDTLIRHEFERKNAVINGKRRQALLEEIFLSHNRQPLALSSHPPPAPNYLPTPSPSIESTPEPDLVVSPLLRQRQSELLLLRNTFRTAGEHSPANFMAVDFEMWDQAQSVVTEVGYTILDFERLDADTRQPRREIQHIILGENSHKRNRYFFPKAREHFDFGRTLELPLDTVFNLLSALIDSLSSSAPLFLIFHDPVADIQAFQRLGFPPSMFAVGVKDYKDHRSGVFVTDTQRLFGGYEKSRGQRNLSYCCTSLGITTGRLHNAGNDAKYTMALFEKLMDPNC